MPVWFHLLMLVTRALRSTLSSSLNGVVVGSNTPLKLIGMIESSRDLIRRDDYNEWIRVRQFCDRIFHRAITSHVSHSTSRDGFVLLQSPGFASLPIQQLVRLDDPDYVRVLRSCFTATTVCSCWGIRYGHINLRAKAS